MIDTSLTHCSCCGAKLAVIDSRRRAYGNVQAVWRRRRCVDCKTYSHTVEMPAKLARKVLHATATQPVPLGKIT
jgi:transcriptional regulator NrdR family protein